MNALCPECSKPLPGNLIPDEPCVATRCTDAAREQMVKDGAPACECGAPVVFVVGAKESN